jgi:hypothetical protein
MDKPALPSHHISHQTFSEDFHTSNMASDHEYGFYLENGTQIVHGGGALHRSAFPPEANVPGQLCILSPGHTADSRTPRFSGPQGLFHFTTKNRMPRHVHLAPSSGTGDDKRYVVEKIVTLNGVALAELGDQIYVIPPNTLVLIGPGVPHSWVACPPGLDLLELGVSEERIVSDGQFLAVFEYEEPTGFFPTAQKETLRSEGDYTRCEDLQSIRFPVMSLEEIRGTAKFVWGRSSASLRERSDPLFVGDGKEVRS